ncbi:MAG: hypothetical protein NC337_13110, partial [Roseburia sp.]|nr:hypothetical protein [Roseburia sp.]
MNNKSDTQYYNQQVYDLQATDEAALHNACLKHLKLFGKTNIIMTAPVFSGEYGGVDDIILTSKYGKTKCAATKIIGSILTALIVTAVTSV